MGLLKVSPEEGCAVGVIKEKTGDAGGVFKETCAEGADIETAVGIGERLLGAE